MFYFVYKLMFLFFDLIISFLFLLFFKFHFMPFLLILCVYIFF